MRAFGIPFLTQLRLAAVTPNYWMAQATTPPQVVLFLSVVDAFDRPDLITHALLAPILMTLWGTALWTGGGVLRNDRWGGQLELHAAAPRSYWWVLAARVGAVVLLSFLTVPITLVTAWITYGVTIEVAHPWLLAAVLVLTAGAITATATVFSAMTLLNRAAITFQSSASYPFLLLGGVFVPLSLLPVWVRPFGRLVFLSWSSDLIRAAVAGRPGSPLVGLVAITVLGVATLALGHRLVRVVFRRVRETGELSYQ